MYTPPSAGSVNFNFSGHAYTPPSGVSVNFNFGGSTVDPGGYSGSTTPTGLLIMMI